jgi:hypothetical protein
MILLNPTNLTGERYVDCALRIGSPTVCGGHPLLRFVPVLPITTVAFSFE